MLKIGGGSVHNYCIIVYHHHNVVRYASEKTSSLVVPSVKCRPLNSHLLPSLGVIRHAAALPGRSGGGSVSDLF